MADEIKKHLEDLAPKVTIVGAAAPGFDGKLRLSYIITPEDAAEGGDWLLRIREGGARPPSLIEMLGILAG